MRYYDRGASSPSVTGAPQPVPQVAPQVGSNPGNLEPGRVSYGAGPNRSVGAVDPLPSPGLSSGGDPGRGSAGSSGFGSANVIDLSDATPARRHIPLPRFAESDRPGRGPGEVRPSVGYTARSTTRPKPDSAATLPARPVTSDDIMSRYRGDRSPSAATRSSATDVPLLSDRRRAGSSARPSAGSASSVPGERAASSTRPSASGGDGAAEPTPRELRERAANAAQKRQRRMNQLAKNDPGRAQEIGKGGLVLGKAVESGLDVGTRILTGGKVGAADLFAPKARPGRGDKGDGKGGKGSLGGLGGATDVGGLSDARGRPGGRGDGSGSSGGAGTSGGADAYGYYGSYGNGYYNNCYQGFSYGIYYGACYPYYGWCYPWVGWGWRACWSWYWYDLGYCWGPYYPRYRYYSVPLYQVTTQVVYQTVAPAEEEVVYLETPGADVNAFTSEAPAGPQTLSTQQSLARASEYYLTLGDRSFREGKYGDAVHFYAKAVEFGQGHGVLYMVLADALFATGDYHYAAFAVRKALELDPNLIDGVVDKGAFYSDPSEFARQVEVLERYVEDHFLDQDARLVLIVNYLFGGRHQAALELLEDDFSKETAATPVGLLLGERLRALNGR